MSHLFYVFLTTPKICFNPTSVLLSKVRLSPDDMASQELAKWRENEAKHSLDMIKKSELELLNCNRQYVLKTHKGKMVIIFSVQKFNDRFLQFLGEQVLEDDRGDKVDNTEVIKSLTEGSTLDDGKSDSSKDKDKKSSKHSHKDKERDRDRKSRDYRHRSLSRERLSFVFFLSCHQLNIKLKGYLIYQ